MRGHSAPGCGRLPPTDADSAACHLESGYLLLTLRIDPGFSVFTFFSGTGGCSITN